MTSEENQDNVPDSRDGVNDTPVQIGNNLALSNLSIREIQKQVDAISAMQSAVQVSKQDKESARAIIEKLASVTEQHGVTAEQIADLLDEKDLKNRGACFYQGGKPVYYDHRSLCIFSHNNFLRKKVVWLIHNNIFDHFISIVILMNSIMLGMTDYDGVFKGPDYESDHNKVLDHIGVYLSVIFLAECVLKIVGMGFIWHKNSYLRDHWNQLDFFVVLVSITDFIPGLEKYSALKVLRTLRILRPLRSVNKIQGMKIIINSFLASIPGLINVCFFLFFVLSIFGIFGVHQFMGKQYQRCRVTEAPKLIDNLPDCLFYPDESCETCPIKFEWEMIDDGEYENAGWICATDDSCQSEYLRNDNVCGTIDNPDLYTMSNGEQVAATCTCGAPGQKTYDDGIDVYGEQVMRAYDAGIDQELRSSGLIFFDLMGFEDFLKAMLTIFVAITLEGWSLMMLNYMDAGGNWVSPIFFILLVLFGAFFALNLVLAEVINSFMSSKEQQEEKDEEARQKLLQEQDALLEKQELEEEEILAKSSKESARKISLDNASDDDQKSEPPMIDSKTKTVTRPNELLFGQLPKIGARQIDMSRMNQLDAQYDQAQMDGVELSGPNSQSSVIQNSQAQMIVQVEADLIDPPVVQEDEVNENDDKLSVSDSEDEKDGNPEIDGEADCDRLARERAQNNRFYNFFYVMVTSHVFNFIIFCLIILNTLVLANEGYPSSPAKKEIMFYCNEFFTWIFFAELVFKIIGLGPRNYVGDSYNVFDSVVVMISLIDWIIAMSVDVDSLGSAAAALQAIKALRLLRMIKLARSWGDMQTILKKTYLSLAELFYVFVILFLFIYIFALLGMELFANKCRFTPNLDGDLVEDVQMAYAADWTMEAPRENFDDTVMALTTVFIITLGEDWPGVMYNYTRIYNNSRLIMLYFIITYSIGNFAMLSLFTAVLLSKFEEKDDDIENESNQKDEDSDEDENEEKPIKPFKNRCFTCCRKIKIEYYQAFATTKLYIDKKTEIEALEEHDDEIWKKNLLANDRKIAPAPDRELNELCLGQAEPDLLSNLSDREQKIQNLDSPAGLRLGQLKSADGKQASQEPLSAVKRPRKMSTINGLNSANKQVTLTSDKKLRYSSKSQKSLSHLFKIMDKELKDESEDVQKIKSQIHGKSLFCLGPESKCRFQLFKLTLNPWFDRVILFFIVLSTIFLAIDTPLDDPESTKIVFLKYCDYVMTGVFVIEMCSKIAALGFVGCGSSSYIKNGWNILDFFIVASAIFSIAFSQYEISFLKALRLLRILRPLRLISRNKSLKLAITSLINSVPDIVNLLIITEFFIIMWAILCTTLLAGKFYHCTTEHLELGGQFVEGLIDDKWDCLNYGGEWVQPDLNFDNTPQSILSLMTIQTTEGWIGVMWSSVDAVAVNQQPIRDYNRYYIIFFLVLIIMLCFLFLNLFVGIVCETYNTESRILSLIHKLDDPERDWIQVQLSAYEAKPVTHMEVKEGEISAFRNCIIKIISHASFDIFIMGCILLNTLLLAVQYYQMDQAPLDVFNVVNYVFMGIFTLEAIVKLIGMKKNYFKDAWNVFDFVVVIVTLVVLILKFIPGLQLDMSSQATIVRILRVLRVLRIVKRAKKLQIIAQTVLEAIPSMSSLGVLLLLFLFLFAVIGNQLFSFVKLQSDLDRQFNFQTFTSSFLLLIRCATGEGWNALMFDTARQRSITFQCDENADYESTMLNNGDTNGCGSPASIAYFIVFLFVVCYIFLNLFIAIVVDTYCAMDSAFRLPITTRDIDMFVNIWKKYDHDATGYIQWRSFSAFLKELADSDCDFFNHNKTQMQDEQFRQHYIRDLEMPCYQNFQCYMFYDVLILMCRETCMFALYPAAKLKSIGDGIEDRAKQKGIEIPQEELTILVRQKILKKQDYQWQFKMNVLSINDKDEKIELIATLREQANKICKQNIKQIDVWMHSDKWEGLYTSKTIYYGVLVVKKWREYMEKKKQNQTPTVKNNIKTSESNINFEDKAKLDKTGQDMTTQLQGQTSQIGKEEVLSSQKFASQPPQSQHELDEVSFYNEDIPSRNIQQIENARSKTPSIPVSTIDLPKVATTERLFLSKEDSGLDEKDDQKSPVSGNWIQQKASEDGTELASTLKHDQDKQ